MNLDRLFAGCASSVATVFLTGCIPFGDGDVTGKVSGEFKLREGISQIAGFDHEAGQASNPSIEVKLQTQIHEPRNYAAGNNPNATGTVRVNDKTLKFDYEGNISFADMIIDSGAPGAPVSNLTLGSEFASKISPESRAQFEKSMKAIKKLDEVHREKGKKFDGAMFAVGFGRNKADKSPVGQTCGSYFYAVTLQVTVDAPTSTLAGLLDGPVADGPTIPAGTVVQYFFATGPCGSYACAGLAEKGKLKGEYTKVVTPPPPTAPTAH